MFCTPYGVDCLGCWCWWIQRLPLGAITALLRLIEDRELTLFDGTRFVRPERYAAMQADLGLSVAELEAKQIFVCHPNFRVMALATPPSLAAPWMSNEVVHLFHFFRRVELSNPPTHKPTHKYVQILPPTRLNPDLYVLSTRGFGRCVGSRSTSPQVPGAIIPRLCCKVR